MILALQLIYIINAIRAVSLIIAPDDLRFSYAVQYAKSRICEIAMGQYYG